MKNITITCDRCGAIIECKRPIKIVIQKPLQETYKDYFGKEHIKSFYKTTKNIHLCYDCRDAFDSFMDGTI